MIWATQKNSRNQDVIFMLDKKTNVQLSLLKNGWKKMSKK